MQYPNAPTVDQVDLYHGTPVADPYRWLEDAGSAQTRAWIEAQNALTFAFLDEIPTRAALRDRLTALWNFERYGLPFTEGGRFFYTRNDGLQNQSVLFFAEGPDAPARVLLDPNALSDDGTVALAGLSVSHDGKFLAYALASAGSDWQEWRIREIDTGQDLLDHLHWAKFTGASWSHEGAGFYYSRYAQPGPDQVFQQANFHHKLYYHRLGTAQDEDPLIYERPDHPDWNLHGGVSDDGRWLVVYASHGTDPKNRIFLQDLADPSGAVCDFLVAGDAHYRVIDNIGDTFFVQTDRDAPRGKLVAIDRRAPEPENWRTLIPEADETLEAITYVGGRFFAQYLRDAKTLVRRFETDGTPEGEVALPGIGTAGGFGGKATDTETYYYFTGYTTPTTLYRYDIATGESILFRQPNVAFSPDDFVTEQVFVTSKDGTPVPMFLSYRNGLERTGETPTYLYGYGGFNVSLTPAFSVAALVWMERGGIYAVANLRGGGEYGEEWHQAGTKANKQNVFDDFQACAQWLIDEKYTRPERLAISGGSNGGLLVGACLTQRPELFGAAVPAVGVLDMLRFHKFTIGWAWTSDYGSPDNPDEFPALHAYSPYHRLIPGTRYPATLITTSDHDDRVVPAHSFKFAAALQAAQAPDGPPTLIRIETRAGHGAGKPITKIIDEVADTFAFLDRALGTTQK